MPTAQPDEPISRKPLRLWPGVVAVAVQWLLRFVLPIFVPEAGPIGVIGGLLCGLLVVVWWLFFSRAPWSERLGALALMIVAMVATSRLIDVSIATGMMGLAFPVYAIPVLCLAFVVWAVATRRLSVGLRRVTMVATILLACGMWTLLRTGGVTGGFASDLSWRWAKTPEQRLLAQAPEASAGLPAASAAPETAADWPGFRGPHRDGIVPGVRIETNWSASPPVQLWRRPIGPGWSSFAVHGDLLYTQEQRGEDEVVACYDAATGKPVWAHRDAARFWESNGGAGPRATPTLSNGRVYSFGATGILNALDARNGTLLWSSNRSVRHRHEESRAGASPSSPLVVGDLVIVAAVGRLAAYDLATGARALGWPGRRRWLQFAATLYDRRRSADPAVERTRRCQRRAGRRLVALAVRVAFGHSHRAAGLDYGWRHPHQRLGRRRGSQHAPPRRHALHTADGPSKSAGHRPG